MKGEGGTHQLACPTMASAAAPLLLLLLLLQPSQRMLRTNLKNMHACSTHSWWCCS